MSAYVESYSLSFNGYMLEFLNISTKTFSSLSGDINIHTDWRDYSIMYLKTNGRYIMILWF